MNFDEGLPWEMWCGVPGRYLIRSITADNGTEFHGYKGLQAATGVIFYFATPHNSWERGANFEHQRVDPPVPA